MVHAFTHKPATRLHLTRPYRVAAVADPPSIGDLPVWRRGVAGSFVRCGHASI